MNQKIIDVLASENPKNKKRVTVVVKNLGEGSQLAKKLLYEACDINSLLLLSGGKTPKLLYEVVAKEKTLKVGAVGVVDERYGSPFHEKSNEKMFREAGFLDFLKESQIPFYPYLKNGLSREEIAADYQKQIADLFFKFPNKIAIMGLGADGHTAGIAPNRTDFKNPLFNKERIDLLVSEFQDPKSIDEGGFGERVTLTFRGLEKIDLFIVLVFGQDKKAALKKMFASGSWEEIPSRFYTSAQIFGKTLLITDQKV